MIDEKLIIGMRRLDRRRSYAGDVIEARLPLGAMLGIQIPSDRIDETPAPEQLASPKDAPSSNALEGW